MNIPLADTSCDRCGYNLLGTIKANRTSCPECGSQFTLSVTHHIPSQAAWLCALMPVVLSVGASGFSLFVVMMQQRWLDWYELINVRPLLVLMIAFGISMTIFVLLFYCRVRFLAFSLVARWLTVMLLCVALVLFWTRFSLAIS